MIIIKKQIYWPLQEKVSSYYPTLQLSSAHEHFPVYPPTYTIQIWFDVQNTHIELQMQCTNNVTNTNKYTFLYTDVIHIHLNIWSLYTYLYIIHWERLEQLTPASLSWPWVLSNASFSSRYLKLASLKEK